MSIIIFVTVNEQSDAGNLKKQEDSQMSSFESELDAFVNQIKGLKSAFPLVSKALFSNAVRSNKKYRDFIDANSTKPPEEDDKKFRLLLDSKEIT